MTWTFPLPGGHKAHASGWTLDQGVDIAAPAHTPLLAVGDGTIVHRGIGGFGADAPVLKLDDGTGYVYYGHAGPAGPKVGTHVKAGQPVGEVGAGRVGISTGPHLEIGLSDARGTPLGRNTAARVKQLLAGGTAATASLPPGSGAAGGNAGSSDPLGLGLTGIAGDVLNPLIDGVVSKAAYAFLAVVFVLGGFALAASGTAKAAGARPQGAV
jgi:murein DD-endopeptidase MepM/ murein hydrolase activator NlpD